MLIFIGKFSLSVKFTSVDPSQVAYPHCATCFGRCYPGGAALISDAKNLFDGIGRLLAAKALPKPIQNEERKSISENGSPNVVENGVMPNAEQTAGSSNVDDKEENITLQTEEKPDNA